MNNKFDELAKGMAQSVTRRQALKKFSFGLAGMALACFGLVNDSEAGTCYPSGSICCEYPATGKDCRKNCNRCCSHNYTCGGIACSCL